MNVTLKPEAQRFVEEQIRSGKFRSTDDVMDEAIARLMIESAEELDDETVAAINRTGAQLDRGEGI